MGVVVMEEDVRQLFGRYARAFNRALSDDIDLDEVATFYTAEFIAASPAGVMGGRNDNQFRTMMAQGYEHYRAIGTKAMRLRQVRISPIDAQHCLADVAWTAVYARKDQTDVSIEFDMYYLVQTLDRQPRIFGWISGDEQALLKAHGIT
jgi:hypothetical protein